MPLSRGIISHRAPTALRSRRPVSYTHLDVYKRQLTWADYVPADVIAAFEKETGITVEVTLSNNEEIISKLRATGGAGYDLAQPSQDLSLIHI